MNRRVLALVLAVLLVSIAALVGPAVEATEVPLEFSPSGSTVDVYLSGEGPFRFLVQTDSEYTFLGDDIVSSLALKATEENGAEIIKVAELKLGDQLFENIHARVIPSEYVSRGESGPHGILGWGVLKDYLVTLDFPRQKLVLKQGKLNRKKDKNVLALEFHPSVGSIDSGQVPSIPIQIGDISLRAEINSTSQSGLALPEELAERIPLQETPGVIGRARTPDGEFVIKGASLDVDVQIGPEVIRAPRARFSGLYKHPGLGYEVLREFAVTFDYGQKLVRLVRPEGVTDPQQVRAAQVAEIGGEATLRAAFNKDEGKVRLLMILSPT